MFFELTDDAMELSTNEGLQLRKYHGAIIFLGIFIVCQPNTKNFRQLS